MSPTGGYASRVINEGEAPPLRLDPASVACGFLLVPLEVAEQLNGPEYVHQALNQNKAAFWAAVTRLNPAVPVHLLTSNRKIEAGDAVAAFEKSGEYPGTSIALDIMHLSLDGGRSFVTFYAGFCFRSGGREVIVAGPQMILPEERKWWQFRTVPAVRGVGDDEGELRRWSWGAFLLTPLWGLFNRVYLGLFALIPVFGLFVAVYLGVRGREMAWRRQGGELAAFRQAQRGWDRAALIVAVLALALWAASLV